jgi:hypothetical protein
MPKNAAKAMTTSLLLGNHDPATTQIAKAESAAIKMIHDKVLIRVSAPGLR